MMTDDDTMLEHALRLTASWSDEKIADYDYYPSACGCMGPQDDYPVCSCGMYAWVDANKDAILLARKAG